MACTGYSAPAFRRCPQARGQGDYNHGAAALSGPCGIAGSAGNIYRGRLIWPKILKRNLQRAVNPTVAFFVSDATAVRRPDGRAAIATRRRLALAQCAAAPDARRCGEPPAPTREPAAWMCLRNCGGRFFSRPLLARWRIVASMARASITSET